MNESFGSLLEEWLRDASDGIRYQLLHRTASPVIEELWMGWVGG